MSIFRPLVLISLLIVLFLLVGCSMLGPEIPVGDAPSANLVFFMPMNESSAPYNDYGGDENNYWSPSGSLGFAYSWDNNYNRYVANFTGTNTGCCANSIVDATDELDWPSGGSRSMSVVVHPHPQTGATNTIWNAQGGGNAQWVIYTNKSGRLFMRKDGGAGADFGIDLNDNEYYHLVFVKDAAADLYLYVNGTLNDTIGAGSEGYSSSHQIGSKDDNSLAWNGTMFNIRIYNGTLTAQEADDIYQEDLVNAALPARFTCDAPNVCTNTTIYHKEVMPAVWGNVSDNTIVYLPLDVGGANSAILSEDISGNDNDAQATGNDVDFSEANTSLDVGKGVWIGGSDDYLKVANSSSLNILTQNKNLSVAFWFTSRNTAFQRVFESLESAANIWMITYHAQDAAHSMCFHVKEDGSDDFTNNCYNDGTNPFAESGKWQHIVWTYNIDNNTATVYINGSVYGPMKSVGGFGWGTTSNRGIYIGVRSDIASDFQGSLDEIAVFDRILTSAEIQHLYRYGGRAELGTFEFNQTSASYNTYNSTTSISRADSGTTVNMSSKHNTNDSDCTSGGFGSYGSEHPSTANEKPATASSLCGFYKLIFRSGNSSHVASVPWATINTYTVAGDDNNGIVIDSWLNISLADTTVVLEDDLSESGRATAVIYDDSDCVSVVATLQNATAGTSHRFYKGSLTAETQYWAIVNVTNGIKTNTTFCAGLTFTTTATPQSAPTTPDTIYCDGSTDCNVSVTTVEINASGSTDADADAITYYCDIGNSTDTTVYTNTTTNVSVDSDVGGDTYYFSAQNCGSECAADAWDMNVATKWLTLGQNTGWMIIELGSGSRRVWKYAICSANDNPTRDWDDWTFEASTDNNTWIVLDTIASNGQWADRQTCYEYALDAPENIGNYTYYKWNVTGNGGDAHTQVSELKLYEQTVSGGTATIWTSIGNHTSGNSITFATEGNYTGLRCAARDLGGSNVTSSYYTIDVSLNITTATPSVCGELSTPGTTTLLNNVQNLSNGFCFNITANNVEIDCAGFTINHTTTTGGVGGVIFDGRVNTTIRNCYIKDFRRGIDFYGSNNTLIVNNTIHSASTSTYVSGIRFNDQGMNYNTTVSNNNVQIIASISGVGVYVHGTGSLWHRDVLIYNNTISANGTGDWAVGLSTEGARNMLVKYNTITAHDGEGIALLGTNQTIEKNTISGGYDGIYISINNGNTSNVIRNNTFPEPPVFYAGTTKSIYFASGGNFTKIYWNNLSAENKNMFTIYMASSDEKHNQFNTSVGGVAQGNYYWNVTSYDVTDSDADGWADGGTEYPINATTAYGVFSGRGQDWGPYTTTAAQAVVNQIYCNVLDNDFGVTRVIT